jgi:hypothetical protein
MPLNHGDADFARIGVGGPWPAVRGKWLVGIVIKFPEEGRIVRFGRADALDESATVIILPVVRIERYGDAASESAEPQSPPPADNGGRRRVRRR